MGVFILCGYIRNGLDFFFTVHEREETESDSLEGFFCRFR